MQELKRVINRKNVILLSVFLLLNAAVVIFSNKGNYDYAKIYNELLDMTVENSYGDTDYMTAERKAWQEYISQYGINGQNVTEAQNKAHKDLSLKAQYIDNYYQMIDDMLNDNKKSIAMDFYDKNSFEYNNLCKTYYDLDNIKDVKVELSNGLWLEKLLDYHYSFVAVLILTFLLIREFVFSKKAGTSIIINASYGGRATLCLKRLAIFVIYTFVITGLFIMENALILTKIYGGAESIMGAAASDENLLLSAAYLSRLEYFILYMLVCWLCIMVFGLGIWLVNLFFSNPGVGIFFYIFLLGADILLYYFVSTKSVFRFLHYINAYYLLFPAETVKYVNWGYGFGITSLLECTIVLGVISIIAAVCIILFVTSKTHIGNSNNVIERGIIRAGELINRVFAPMVNVFKEIYKVILIQRIGFVMLALVYVVMEMSIGVKVLYNHEMSTMLLFYDKADNLYKEEDLEKIYDEYEADYEELAGDLENNGSEEENSVVLMNRKRILSEVRKNIDYVLDKNRNGEDAVIVSPYEYTAALGENQRDNRMILFICNIIDVLLISVIFLRYDKISKVESLIIAAKNRGRWFINKIAANVIIIAIFTVITYVIYYFRLFNVYEIPSLTIPIKSLHMFSGYPMNISVLGYIGIEILKNAAVMCALSLCICLVIACINYGRHIRTYLKKIS